MRVMKYCMQIKTYYSCCTKGKLQWWYEREECMCHANIATGRTSVYSIVNRTLLKDVGNTAMQESIELFQSLTDSKKFLEIFQFKVQ
jgi:hypothetical protein